MFGWFRPTCPVDSAAKNWIESRLIWLSKQFGMDTFVRRAVVRPTNEFFECSYSPTPKGAQALLQQVSRYMDVDPDRVSINIFTDKNPLYFVNEQGLYLPKVAGLYEEGFQTTIHLESSQLENPMDLVGTMAHELAHLRLMGEGRVTGEGFDNELLTDLTVVFYGLGLFLANSPRAWQSQFSTWPGTNIKRPEYMTMAMFGYALAHAAWLRNERNPNWLKNLRPDARAETKQGIRFLFETSDSKLLIYR
ncbi:MAG: hypothetical protein KDA80_06020 [Planctomycetaceae bacterium]|nr:hypothetical protein [Planctomycetaceae bacterium]